MFKVALLLRHKLLSYNEKSRLGTMFVVYTSGCLSRLAVSMNFALACIQQIWLDCCRHTCLHFDCEFPAAWCVIQSMISAEQMWQHLFLQPAHSCHSLDGMGDVCVAQRSASYYMVNKRFRGSLVFGSGSLNKGLLSLQPSGQGSAPKHSPVCTRGAAQHSRALGTHSHPPPHRWGSSSC